MRTKTFLSIISAILFLPLALQGQNIEKIKFDVKDSTDGYYLAIQPQSKNSKGVLFLLTSFLPPDGVLPETKLHNVAYANDILTIVASAKQKLYADSSAVNRVTSILNDVSKRFSIDPSKFVLAGYDESGGIVLRYTELTYENPKQFSIQPKAVFGIDSHVDLFGFWHWSEKQIKKNYWAGAVGDAHFYIDTMTKENGTIYNNADRYKSLTPFYREGQEKGNEQYLVHVPVRLYYDTDIDWQLKNRRNSFYDTKMPDGSELINRLLLLGNNKAEFITSKQPGLRSNGIRNPNSLSIVDEVECIHWIKKSLNIFDVNTWIPPYTLMTPADWGDERFSLPPDFAPQISYSGVEEIRFAPGWGEIKSEEHWSYCFVWWLDGKPKIDAITLQSNLKEYYTGLVGRNIASRDIPSNKIFPTVATIKKIKTISNDLETYNGTISMLDYHSQEPMILNCVIHLKNIKATDHTAIYFEISPKPLSHVVWKKMDEIGDSFGVKN